MILATEEVVTITLNVISIIIKTILATGEVLITILKVISATTTVILATNNLISARKSGLGHKKTILSNEEVITFTSYLS